MPTGWSATTAAPCGVRCVRAKGGALVVDQALAHPRSRTALAKPPTHSAHRAAGSVRRRREPACTDDQLGTVLAYFRLPSSPFVTPVQFDKYAYLGTFNLSGMQPYDFLVEPVMGCFYIASIDPVSYPFCVRTNPTITVTRSTMPIPSNQFYGGDAALVDAAILSGWPATIVPKGRHMRTAQLLMRDEFLRTLLGASPEARASIVFQITGGWAGPEPDLLAWTQEPRSWILQ